MLMALIGDLAPRFSLVGLCEELAIKGRMVEVPQELFDRYDEILQSWEKIQDELGMLPPVTSPYEPHRP